MVRFPYPRLASLFDALQSETLPQDELAKRFAVSTRTVRADITALNDILESYGAQFVHSRGAGYRLQVDDQGPGLAHSSIGNVNSTPRRAARRSGCIIC
ncbi:Probable licABCH operon regulator [Serratia fonticola]|uniref:Probable licABCH operon regulator n=1 Tax=Serratia fonticola TaxID=47917 RepID=A0A4U9W9F8_SERFO|nr:Probable licABCH operon regulator [Serratia fonticola]